MKENTEPSSHYFAFHTKRHFMQDYFVELDFNESSYLEREEVAAALIKIHGVKFTDTMVDDVFNKDDKDGDGRLSFVEARQLCFSYATYIDDKESKSLYSIRE